jgi:hypothetical protein
MDSAGRILISPELRAAVGMTREVMLLGMGRRGVSGSVRIEHGCKGTDVDSGPAS